MPTLKTPAGNTYTAREDGVIEICLTQGKIALIYAEDLPLIANRKWFAVADRSNCYAGTKIPANGKRPMVRLHRFLIGANPGEIVDHVNGDGLDNRRSNIRFCTPSENARNKRSARSDNRTGVLGVTFEGKTNRYRATIRLHGKPVFLGVFADIESATAARIAAEIEYHGEFASSKGAGAER